MKKLAKLNKFIEKHYILFIAFVFILLNLINFQVANARECSNSTECEGFASVVIKECATDSECENIN
jgi:hypothetical protein